MAQAETVIRGQNAFERRDWSEAYALFAAADRDSRLEAEDIERFAEVLREAGIQTSVRYSRGLEIAAACGQLRARHTTGSQQPAVSAQ